MQKLNKSEFKPNALAIMREIQKTNKSVIITERGKPVLVIRPYKEDKKDPLEDLKGSVLEFKDHDQPVFEDDEWDIS